MVSYRGFPKQYRKSYPMKNRSVRMRMRGIWKEPREAGYEGTKEGKSSSRSLPIYKSKKKGKVEKWLVKRRGFIVPFWSSSAFA